jgi:hypothetical protein
MIEADYFGYFILYGTAFFSFGLQFTTSNTFQVIAKFDFIDAIDAFVGLSAVCGEPIFSELACGIWIRVPVANRFVVARRTCIRVTERGCRSSTRTWGWSWSGVGLREFYWSCWSRSRGCYYRVAGSKLSCSWWSQI